MSPRRRHDDLPDRKDKQRWSNNNTNNEARWPDNDDDNNNWLTNWGGLLDDDDKITAYTIDENMMMDVGCDVGEANG